MFELDLPCATAHPHGGRQGYGASPTMHVDSSGTGAVLREPLAGAPKRAGAVPHAAARRACDARHDKAHGAGWTPGVGRASPAPQCSEWSCSPCCHPAQRARCIYASFAGSRPKSQAPDTWPKNIAMRSNMWLRIRSRSTRRPSGLVQSKFADAPSCCESANRYAGKCAGIKTAWTASRQWVRERRREPCPIVALQDGRTARVLRHARWPDLRDAIDARRGRGWSS